MNSKTHFASVEMNTPTCNLPEHMKAHCTDNWEQVTCKNCLGIKNKKTYEVQPFWLGPEYHAWVAMRSRCLNNKSHNYKYYGDRGITICKEWDKFKDFFADMGPRPTITHSLDRIDVNKGYCKANCRWATKEEQNQNKRTCVYYTINGIKKTKSQWGAELKVSVSMFRYWEELGKTFKGIYEYYTFGKRRTYR